MKRAFGPLVIRILRSGATLTAVEYHLLCLLVGSLPPHLRGIVERQFESYNLVQREIDRRALNFYRVRTWKNKVLPVTPLLESKLQVAPLMRISAIVNGESLPLHAVLTAVDGRAFSVSFSHAVSKRVEAEDVSVQSVTHAWKSNFSGERDAA